MQEFVVVWNEETHGEIEPQIVSMAEIKKNFIKGGWGIDECGGFPFAQCEDIELGETHTVYAPWGWSIKILKIKEVA